MHDLKMKSILSIILIIISMNLVIINNHIIKIRKQHTSKKVLCINNGKIINKSNNCKVKFDNILQKEEEARIEEQKRVEEQKRLEEEQKQIEQENEPLSRGKDIEMTKVSLTLSHYGDTAGENGGYAHTTASGQSLHDGVVASNNFKLGTEVYIDYYKRDFTVLDTGNRNVLKKLPDGSIKIDIFVPRNEGESDEDYRQRIMDLGIIKTYGYVYG